MKGASASTLAARTSNRPVAHRKMASGIISFFSEPPFHRPRARSPVEPNAPFGPHRKHAGHEAGEAGAAGRQVEEALRLLDRAHRGERTELLAILDVAIEAVAHFGRMGRREQAAIAERARAEFGAALD